jgi:AraC-like DNA-binding protein
MKFTKKLPSEALNKIVKSFWKIEIENEDVPLSQLHFPYGSFELIFYLKSRGVMQYIGQEATIVQPEFYYTGQFTKPYTLSFNEPCIFIGVSFMPWVGNFLFGIPGNEFTDSMINISDLEKNEFAINTLINKDKLFVEIEKYLMAKLVNIKSDLTSEYIAKSIISNPKREVSEFAIKQIGLSRRRIEQKFLESSGLSIGSFTRKIRFQKAIYLLENNLNKEHLINIGLEAGYYDQSHFISEFKEYASITPKIYTQQATDLRNFIGTISLNN